MQHGEALGRWAGARRPVLGFQGRVQALHSTATACRWTQTPSVRGSRTRRADRALHRRDGDQLLLHRPGRGDAGAGAEAGLPEDRRRRAAPLQALLHPRSATRSARIASALGAYAAPARSHPSSPRTTSWPTPISRPTAGPAAPTTAARLQPRLCATGLQCTGPRHIERGIAMVLKAVGLTANGRLNALMTRAGLWFLRSQRRQVHRSGVSRLPCASIIGMHSSPLRPRLRGRRGRGRSRSDGRARWVFLFPPSSHRR